MTTKLIMEELKCLEISPLNARQVSSHNSSSCNSTPYVQSLSYICVSPLFLPSPMIKLNTIQRKISNLELK